MNVDGIATTPVVVQKRGSWSGGEFDNFDQHDAHEAFLSLTKECVEVDLRRARDLHFPQREPLDT